MVWCLEEEELPEAWEYEEELVEDSLREEEDRSSMMRTDLEDFLPDDMYIGKCFDIGGMIGQCSSR